MVQERQSGVAGCGLRVTRASPQDPGCSRNSQPATWNSGNGNAHEPHFTPSIRGSARQHAAQQEAVRSLQGSSFPQATHHDGRTIRSASRPTNDNALASVRTRDILRGAFALKNQNPICIVPAMKRTFLLLALLAVAAPALAQEAHEFGVLVGGSRRFVWGGDNVRSITNPPEQDWIESNFSLSNTSVELYWGLPIEPDLDLKFKAGRIESEIAIPYIADDPLTAANDPKLFRRDVANGEVQHIEAIVEYEFDEPFGSSGLFAGAGFYRLSAAGEETQQSYGVTAGVNTDFPITRRYGVILEAAYHWLPALEFNPRYMTVSGGLRVSF